MRNPFKRSTKPAARRAIAAQIEHTERRKQEHSMAIGRDILYSASELPACYDESVFDGTRYVGGKACNTVGELKAANAKFYGHT